MNTKYDRDLIARMVEEGIGGPFSRAAVEEQIRLLREADNADAANIGTVVAPPSVAGDAGEFRGYDSAESRDKAIARMVHDFPTLAAFHSRHAMESKLPASCLCCGHSMDGRKAVIQHAELPNIVICEQCRRLATAEQPGSAVQGEAVLVGWCALNNGGTGLAYFDGKPMVMPGKVGNEHHPVPLYAGAPPAPAAEQGVSIARTFDREVLEPLRKEGA